MGVRPVQAQHTAADFLLTRWPPAARHSPAATCTSAHEHVDKCVYEQVREHVHVRVHAPQEKLQDVSADSLVCF